MRKTSFVLAAVTVLTTVGACDAWLTKPALYNSVKVITQQRNGDPISGVNMVLYTGQRPMGYGMTGTDGGYTFTRVPQGLYGVQITVPDGYRPDPRTTGQGDGTYIDGLRVAKDSLSPVRFILLKPGPGTIVVTTQQPDGVPVPGTVLTLYSPTKVLTTLTTDATGRVVFDPVPFGTYGVVATRPPLYRDYRAPSDSLYTYHDGLIVEAGDRDSVVFVFAKCSGAIRVLALDQSGTPVAGATAAAYGSTGTLATAMTGADGTATIGELPCAVGLGVTISPPAGYVVSQGRGSSFADGLSLTNGATAAVTFHLRR